VRRMARGTCRATLYANVRPLSFTLSS
jgi:hypothetical protein